MEELISVIVPIYNVEKYLNKCLESILGQTYKNIEIILINDGSTDKSKQICEEYINLDKRIVYVEQNNKGVSDARNKGIEKAKGKFILFVDADDYIEFNMIEKLYIKAKEFKCDIVISNYNIIENDKVIKDKYAIEKTEITRNEFIKYMLIEKNYGGYLWNKLIKRKVISNCRFDINIHIMEDLIFLLEISKNINSAYILNDEYLYYYVQHNSSALHNKNEKYLTNTLAYEKIFNYIKKDNLIDQYNYYAWKYIYTFMENYYYMKSNGTLTIEYKKKRNKEIKKTFKQVLKGNINKFEKIKLIIIFYFPSLYYMLKKRKVEK